MRECKIPLIMELKQHNPFAREFFKFLEDKDAKDLIQSLAMKGIYSFPQFQESVIRPSFIQSFPVFVAEVKRASLRETGLKDTDIVVDSAEVTRLRLLNLYREEMDDTRLGSLSSRLLRFQDRESNAWAALFSSNCVETGLSSWPTRFLFMLFGVVYFLLGLLKMWYLSGERRWVPQPDQHIPVEPRVLRISVVIDAVANLTIMVMVFILVAAATYSSPLRGRRIFIMTLLIFIIFHLTGGVADYVQCPLHGQGIGSVCNGYRSIFIVCCVALIVLILFFKQRFVWCAGLLVQGAYLLYMTWREPRPVIVQLLMTAAASTLVMLSGAIYVKHQSILSHTTERLKHDMSEFESMWNMFMNRDQHGLDELAEYAAQIRATLATRSGRHRKYFLCPDNDSMTWGGKRKQVPRLTQIDLTFPLKLQSLSMSAIP